jgi:hypothetical protein
MSLGGKIDLADLVNKLSDTNKGGQVFIGFIFIGIVVKILLGISQPATATIWGYFIIAFSIIGLLFLSTDTTKNDMESLKDFFQPLLLLVIVLIWSITLNFRYYKEINKNRVPKQYFLWSHSSTILICGICVLSIIGFIVKTDQFVIYNYILMVFNLIVVGIQQVILDSFTVDG